MRNHLDIAYSKVALETLTPECRKVSDPELCQARIVSYYHQVLTAKVNGSFKSEVDVLYYEDIFYQPPTATETFIHYFYLIVFPYLLLFGTLGNIISATITRRYSHNVWSTCVYMAIVFPMDLIKLYVECGNDWLEKLYDNQWSLSQEILLLSNAVCKVYTFTYSLLLQEAEWIIVAVAIETAIAVKQPMSTYRMCTRERASAIVLFISVLLISLNLHFFWTNGLVVPGDDPEIDFFMCTYISELSDRFRDYIWPVLRFCVEDMGPFIMIMACMLYCLTTLVQDKSRRNYDKLLEKYFLDIKTLNEMKRGMVGICVVSILSLICGMLAVGLRFFINKEVIDISYDHLIFTTSILSTISYIFMSHKFWIFYICCERFRTDVKQMLRTMCMPWRMRRKYTHRYTLRDTKQEATVSWQETETCLSKENEPSTFMLQPSNIPSNYVSQI